MASANTLYKLIILYLLKQVKFPLNNSRISEFVVEKGYLDYFRLQELLTEMEDTGLLVTESTHQTTSYGLTEEGRNTIDFFEKEMDPSLTEDIRTYLKSNALELRNESSVHSSYARNAAGDYSAELSIREGNTPILTVTIDLPTEANARTACENWKAKSGDLYRAILKELL